MAKSTDNAEATVSVKKTLEIGKGKPGPGRPKGMPNKATTLLKDAILQAAEKAGAGDIVVYLTTQARDNPGPFLTLLGKVLPLTLAGDPNAPLGLPTLETVRIIFQDPRGKETEKDKP